MVKEHDAEGSVNSVKNGGFIATDTYSVYPNGFFRCSNDGSYTKHIYIGAERIASQVGGKPYPSPNTESVSVAGRSNGIDIRVDYSGKLDQHLAQIDSVYDAFDLPYNGTNHDSYYDNYFFDRPGYWDNTEGMTLNGGEPETPRGIQDRDLLYYYHRDHLGSSTAVSNDDGKLSQQIEYLPYGEVFLEKQMASGDYHSPFRFNGKELDEETGLYYYGARYMNPRLSIWYGTDPMQEKYPDISSYSYCAGNPINFVDFRGDSLIVAPEYQDLFNKALTDVFGGIISKGFVYDNNGVVSFNGDIKGMSKKQREIFNDFKKVLASKTITHIIYAERYNVKDKNGCIATIIPEITGGEGTLLACDYKNFTQNYVVINPLASQEIKIYSVTDNYYKTYGTVPTPDSEPNFKIETIKTNVSNLTWHGIGHVIYGGKTQNKVLDFDNKVREIMNLPKRPYDQTHNKMITTNISGNVWGY